MTWKRAGTAALFALQLHSASASPFRPIVSSPGDTSTIPRWDLQSSAHTGDDLTTLSRPGVDTSAWHHVGVSRCTLMGCLVETGVYNEDKLFHSTNLQEVDEAQFAVPWIYRHEFALHHPTTKTGEHAEHDDRHFFLQTHGISSRADIWLNGKQVADKATQAGSYAGRDYDITALVAEHNALAIQVYPTDYYYDFALGWVDWNPWPADNGTGVWRDVEIKQTGPVRLEPLRVVTELGEKLGDEPAKVTLKAKAHNLKNATVHVEAEAVIVLDGEEYLGNRPLVVRKTVTLKPFSATDVVLSATIDKPRIWWPRQWGEQPLYTAKLTVTPSSDTKGKKNAPIFDHASTTFGLRTVTKTLAHDDTTFHINHRRFQVIGAGYSPNLFLRSSPAQYETELAYVLDLGLNTIRLEGKNEHPELYALADKLGLMIMAGWECCDKWEAWSYNTDLAVDPVPVWDKADYAISRQSTVHEAAMMQTHPSLLAYLIGSDYWPNDKATKGYIDAFHAADWQVPIVASASKRGYPNSLGPSGLKMDGPYDWVPPGYWWDVAPSEDRLGAAFGFGSELGSGVGTPELGSLRKFLSESDLDDLWKHPNKSLYHMSRKGSSFETREIYNAGLFHRWGKPTSLSDYLFKAQITDYEATRSQFDAVTARWNADDRPATGLIYWMLNNAWPSLHWNLWDYYLRPAGGYFGAKTATRLENVVFDYHKKGVWLINRSQDKTGNRTVQVEIINKRGKLLHHDTIAVTTQPNTSKHIFSLAKVLARVNTDVVFIKFLLNQESLNHDDKHTVLSRNVYWDAHTSDILDWDNSDWYFTPVTSYSDYTPLNTLAPATVHTDATTTIPHHQHDKSSAGVVEVVHVELENKSPVPAFFISLALVDGKGEDVLPVRWSENYVTLWPGERVSVKAEVLGGWRGGVGRVEGIVVRAKNVAERVVGV
ncbi:glycoside hydrolase [Dichotomopilus funicola]|uniref:Glycoside hydrolase n=1 Tax=Dichotomopilus funicola TaxID=1934379 RepID=A0AAN6UTS7_9PEZI|nr:glycoside hydrolase [Dichotomopilus funicola]